MVEAGELSAVGQGANAISRGSTYRKIPREQPTPENDNVTCGVRKIINGKLSQR